MPAARAVWGTWATRIGWIVRAAHVVLVTWVGLVPWVTQVVLVTGAPWATGTEQVGQGRDTDMGERQSGGGMPGRRRAHPGGTAPGHTPHRTAGAGVALDEDALEALLAAAMLRHRGDAEGEQRAVAAFRAAREAGLHQARTRRRDDWRPREQRRLARSLKATLSLFAASLALGGVAVAAIGSSDSSDGPADDRGGSNPSASAPDRPATEPSSATSGTGSERPGHPATAQDTEARCRAYEKVEDSGKALDSTAWQRLVTAAGGEDKVAAYCAGQLARATASPRPGRSAAPGNGAAGATNGADNATSGAGNADKGAGSAGNGAGNADKGAGSAGNGAGNADNGAGSADSGAGNGKNN